jgi:hypothetical protein
LKIEVRPSNSEGVNRRWKREQNMKSYALAVALSAVFGLCASSSITLAQQKTGKVCQEEWRANKADNQAKGITEKAYVDQCRAGGATAKPAAAPAPAPAAAAPAKPAPAPAAAAPAPARPAAAPAAATTPTGANEFATDAQAKARCPADTVVWVNLSSKVYHFAGSKDYGKTKKGAYMCEKDASSQGTRAAKNEKHP